MEVNRREGPYIKIVEQPASKALRFRYECEGRSAGSIPGVNSTPENKTYPTIQIIGYKGRAVVVVSCVTKDLPHKPHPHNLVGRDGCKKGVCTVEVHNETMTQSFDHLGIQCVKKKDIEEALKAREEIRVDPFRTGFLHRTQAGSIDLNAVRLCFQAFLEDEPNSGKFKVPLIPVVSDIIYDKKALCDLAICKLSHCSAPVAGGLEMILLCEKVAKEDIAVRLYEERNGEVVWVGEGDFTPTQVHKQVAITFKTPRYKNIQVENPVQVYIQLRRPSDGETSDPLPFQLTPLDSGVLPELNRKKAKVVHNVDPLLLVKDPTRAAGTQLSPGLTVKREPSECSPNPYVLYTHEGAAGVGGPAYRTPSPMDYNPVSPNYPGMVYQANLATSVGVAFPSRTASAMTALSPVHVGLSSPPQNMQAAAVLSPSQAPVDRVSPHPHPVTYTILGNPDMYLQTQETLHNGNNYFTDITPPIQGISSEPMEALTVNSKDFSGCLYLSESLSNNLILNSDVNPAGAPVQENMTDSFTKLANSAYKEFEEN